MRRVLLIVGLLVCAYGAFRGFPPVNAQQQLPQQPRISPETLAALQEMHLGNVETHLSATDKRLDDFIDKEFKPYVRENNERFLRLNQRQNESANDISGMKGENRGLFGGLASLQVLQYVMSRRREKVAA